MSKSAEKITGFPEKNRYSPETAQALLALSKKEDFIKNYPLWINELHSKAKKELEDHGLPSPRLERWKYTNLPAQAKDFGATLAKSDVSYCDPDNLVGSLANILPEAPDWLVSMLTERDNGAFRYGDMMLWDLCNLFLRDGLVVDVPAGKSVKKPIEITITGHDKSFFVPRTAFRLGEGAELTIIEYHTGQGRYWNNRLTQIIVGPNAKLRHYRIQENAPQAVYTQNTQVKIERDGTYEAFTLTTGAGLSRNQVHAALNVGNASCNIYGLNLLRGAQHADTTVEIEHRASHCRSDQFIRSVLEDRAHGVFQGKVHVHEGAQKTDAYQLSNALLLSEGAEMDTKPELEIYADDVKCSHGATTGRLEEEPLFYMRSRGLPEPEARALLIEAFAGEVLEKLGDESVRELVGKRVGEWLKKRT